MEDNFYIKTNYEFETMKKGMLGTFSAHKVNLHKYMKEFNFEEYLTIIKSIIKEPNASIDFCIDNLDWYGEPITCCRLFNFYGTINFVNFEGAEYGIRSSTDKMEVSTREIRQLVQDFVDRFNKYADANLKEENKVKYEVDFYDYSNGATSTIDTIIAPENYTAEQYIKDCKENADEDYVEMLSNGRITLVKIEE